MGTINRCTKPACLLVLARSTSQARDALRRVLGRLQRSVPNCRQNHRSADSAHLTGRSRAVAPKMGTLDLAQIGRIQAELAELETPDAPVLTSDEL